MSGAAEMGNDDSAANGTQQKPATATWRDLLKRAVANAGETAQAYQAFPQYSGTNRMLIMIQCLPRGIPPEPVDTFNGWLARGRTVRRGERGMGMWVPRRTPAVRRHPVPTSELSGADLEALLQPPAASSGGGRKFIFLNHWFAMSQTEGEAIRMEPPIPFSLTACLEHLAIDVEAFTCPDPAVEGYATGRTIAINSDAGDKAYIGFHEIAHVLLEHNLPPHPHRCVAGDGALLEAEAECVAVLCCSSLGIPVARAFHDYIEDWLDDGSLSDEAVSRIFLTTDDILRAGRGEKPAAVQPRRRMRTFDPSTVIARKIVNPKADG